jgi:hypothetical protein
LTAVGSPDPSPRAAPTQNKMATSTNAVAPQSDRTERFLAL